MLSALVHLAAVLCPDPLGSLHDPQILQLDVGGQKLRKWDRKGRMRKRRMRRKPKVGEMLGSHA